MKASIGDVALKAGVSNATVSRTFAHPEQVSEATRLKVQAAADALNFSVSRSAGILKSGRTYRIALLVGSGVIEWFTAEIIAGLNDVLRDAGYDLVIYPIEGSEARDAFFEELPVRSNADAVFVSSFGISPRRGQTSRNRKNSRLSVSIPPAKDSMQLSVSTTKKASNSSFGISPSWDIVTCCIYMKAFPPHWDSAHLTVFPDSKKPAMQLTD
mgnify:CR=1 FL=1